MKEEKLLYADETYAIRGAAFEVYKEMGNAFDENVYQECPDGDRPEGARRRD